MIISRKEYRFRKNTSMGNPVIAIIALCVFLSKVYTVIEDGNSFEWKHLIWLALSIASFVAWKWRERMLENFDVEDE